jgi:DNA polymerase (family 10)
MARTMTNAEVAATFRRLADLLAIRGEDAYRDGAYRRAASIGQTPESIAALRQRGRLQEIPGVGAEIAQKIADLLDTGYFRLLREVEAQFPPGIASLLSVPGIGPRRARALYQTLGIDSLDALRAALAEGRLGAAGIGPREAERIAAGLTSLQATDERLPLATAQALGRDVLRQLSERVPAIRHIALAGSLRRMRETIGDLDIAAAAEDPAAVVAAFAALPAIARVELRGPTRCRVVLHNGVPTASPPTCGCCPSSTGAPCSTTPPATAAGTLHSHPCDGTARNRVTPHP